MPRRLMKKEKQIPCGLRPFKKHEIKTQAVSNRAAFLLELYILYKQTHRKHVPQEQPDGQQYKIKIDRNFSLIDFSLQTL